MRSSPLWHPVQARTHAVAYRVTADTVVRMTVLVSGEVQGVGYRAFAQRQAQDLGLQGYAENLGDGRVEIVAEGERADLEHFLHLLKRGPAHAEVGAVTETWGEASALRGFYTY